MQYLGFEAFEKSINNLGTSVIFMARDRNETVLIIVSRDGKSLSLGFKGSVLGEGKFRAPLSHENAVVLRNLFPFTAPIRGLS